MINNQMDEASPKEIELRKATKAVREMFAWAHSLRGRAAGGVVTLSEEENRKHYAVIKRFCKAYDAVIPRTR